MKEAGRLDREEKTINSIVQTAWELVHADEMANAEWLLTKGLPGYYRDRTPEAVMAMREKIRKFKMTIHDYAAAPDDFRLVDPIRAKEVVTNALRGQCVLKNVTEYNERGVIPHIIEMGPGEFWLPLGLKELGCKFTYQTFFLHKNAYDAAKKYFEDLLSTNEDKRPVIYVACEIIEHLHDVHEIPQTLLKTGHTAEWVHLSTPRYTFGFGNTQWDEPHMQGLGGHLRTYTPDEFKAIACELFPLYNWYDYTAAEVMSLIGIRRGTNGTQ